MVMNINPNFLEMSFENIGIRDSQKRLKQLITDLAVNPLRDYHEGLLHKFSMVEIIVAKRIAEVIIHWLQHKHNPVLPRASEHMSEITNATRADVTLKQFFLDQIKDAMLVLAVPLALELPDPYEPESEELEYALIELEERFERDGTFEAHAAEQEEQAGYDYAAYEDFDPAAYGMVTARDLDYGSINDYDRTAEDANPVFAMADDISVEDDEDESTIDIATTAFNLDSFLSGSSAEDDDSLTELTQLDQMGEIEGLASLINERVTGDKAAQATPTTENAAPAPTTRPTPTQQAASAEPEEAAIMIPERPTEELAQRQQPQPEPSIDINVLDLTAERAWELIYNMIGFRSEYIQQQMLPRWRQTPELFEKDRKFLYQTFTDTVRNASGGRAIAGHFRFVDRPLTVDQLWGHYFADLSQNVGPLLTQARLQAAVDTPRWRKILDRAIQEFRKLNPIWLLALAIALVFDGLTTYVSLDQTPMEGPIVLIFTGLITALFQIADLLVINYRKREFDADALIAKYQAQYDRLNNMIEGLDTSSESFVQISMQRSQAMADRLAAEDSRKMARRGRYWSIRIADINVIVTAYGFAYLFLDATEPMLALVQQVNVIINRDWPNLNLWVFLMIGLAITVSFVINTAQRTEMLGWSMRRLRENAFNA